MKKPAVMIMLLSICTLMISEQYHITDVRYQIIGRTKITGKTKQSALERQVPVNTKRIFDSREDLDHYLVLLKQEFTNLRVFSSNEITPSFLDADSDNVIPVLLDIVVTETATLLAVPYPKYDSNSGFSLKVKTKDNNFLGLLLPLTADVFYEMDQDSETQTPNHILGINFNYTYPFALGMFDFEWVNDLALSYGFGDQDVDFGVSTGLKTILPFDRFSLQLTFTQSFKIDSSYKDNGDMFYLTEKVQFAVPVRLGTIGSVDIKAAPEVHFNANWDGDGITHPDLLGPSAGLGYSISSSRINWLGNYRYGFSADFGQSFDYNFGKDEFTHMISAEAKFFYSLLNARAYAFVGIPWWNDGNFVWGQKDIGAQLRGIRDVQTGMEDVSAGLIFNFDIPIRVVETDWRGWLEKPNKKKPPNWLRIFDFELQISPFIDIALTRNDKTGRTFSLADAWYSGGVELLVYPTNWRSYVVRISAGFDLGRIMNLTDTTWRENASKWEIYFGLGAHY